MTSYYQKIAYEKYRKSPKGKAARRKAQDKYNRSGKGKLARQRYEISCKGQESRTASNKNAAVMKKQAATNS